MNVKEMMMMMMANESEGEDDAVEEERLEEIMEIEKEDRSKWMTGVFIVEDSDVEGVSLITV